MSGSEKGGEKMSRYIDAEWIRSLYADFKDYGGRTDWETPVANVLATIDDAPSIDIVRCSECKHWCNHKDADYDQSEFVYYCDVHKVSFSGIDFCSYGEREGE